MHDPAGRGKVAATKGRAASCVLSEPQRGTVAQIIDGETLALTDGTIVRLIGAKAPSPPLGWRGDDPWLMVAERRRSRRLSGSPRAPKSN